jgi:hypothetical protein
MFFKRGSKEEDGQKMEKENCQSKGYSAKFR